MKRAIGTVVLMLVICTPASAADPAADLRRVDTTVRGLMEVCEHDETACLYYTQGVYQALMFARRPGRELEKASCIPDLVTAGQLTDVMTAFIRKHRAEDNVHQAVAPAFVSWVRAWPCETKEEAE